MNTNNSDFPRLIFLNSRIFILILVLFMVSALYIFQLQIRFLLFRMKRHRSL